ncbi:uncharacterized protein LOC119688334 [Teleopsis dalmanni]|uniref:uncharacterized protein LOC119688334 n=1 Tax=Teleopsis dalmanni TaxID=139649 RepID=UPI0018CFE627|nr:uncharacterized protein LOC119688334 [Teleopsis dalmanni]
MENVDVTDSVVYDSDFEDTDNSDIYFDESSVWSSELSTLTKRSYLSQCIHQIYIVTGKIDLMPSMRSFGEQNPQEIMKILDEYVSPPAYESKHDSIQRIKRRLFYAIKTNPRKQAKPQWNNALYSEIYHFKPTRHIFGERKIRKNYLDDVRTFIAEEIRLANLEHNKTYDYETDSTEESDINIETCDESNQIYHQKNYELCHYHKTKARHQPHQDQSSMWNTWNKKIKLEETLLEEQYDSRSKANQKMIEESIRSIYYMKTLLRLTVGVSDDEDDDDNEEEYEDEELF